MRKNEKSGKKSQKSWNFCGSHASCTWQANLATDVSFESHASYASHTSHKGLIFIVVDFQ